MTKQDIEKQITDLAQLLALECRKVHERCDWSSYSSAEINIDVSWSPDRGPQLELRFINPTGPDVRAKSLDRLMDEVFHRLDFDDKEAGKEPLKALTDQSEEYPPEPIRLDDEILF